jgi:aryl-alcohol dehydrogenase-like predicted oxidoreductase
LNTASIQRRPLGATGLTVPAVGLGAMQLGDPAVPEAEAERLLRGALELGAGLIDTARSYGLSEDRIGRFLSGFRDEFVLSTKLGYGIEGIPDWTPEAVSRGIDAARERLRTDVIDIVHLHSCDRRTLEHGGVADALLKAVDDGKVGVAAYSGENEALEFAVASGWFGVVQASVSFCDQAALDGALAAAGSRGVGVLAKRPLATAPWRGQGAEPVYAERFGVLAATIGEAGDWADTALRFAAFAPGVSSALVGTRSLERLAAAVASAARGPLSAQETRRLAEAFRRAGTGWKGIV